MANVKITELPSITGANAATTDVLPLVDVSADVTSKITRSEFFTNVPAISSTGTLSLSATGANNITASTNGSERLRITSNGNVGIGTASPTQKLDVNGSITVADTFGYAWGGAGTGTYLSGSDALDFISAHTAGSERMRIDSSGNLGVGQTSPSAWLVNGIGIGSGAADWGATIYTGTAASGYLCFADGTTTTDRYRGYLQYSHASDAMVFGTSAVERMRIDSNGNVGIGTASPTATFGDRVLHIAGTASANSEVRLTHTTSGTGSTDGFTMLLTGSDGYLYNRETGNLILGTANTERMRIDSAGNLGLGVTPSAWWSQIKALQVGGSSSLTDYSASANRQTTVASNAFLNASVAWTYINSDPATRYTQNQGTHQWFTAPSGTAGNAITFTQAMTLDASGQLGVGTTSVGAPLHIKGGGGSINSILDSSVGDTRLELRTNGTRAGYIYWDASENRFFTDTGRFTSFYTGGSERARIHASGGVSIGNTTDPGATNLSVTGSVTVSGPIQSGDVHYIYQPGHTAKAAAATLTAAELLTGIIRYTGAAANLTLPTGTDIEAGVISGLGTNRAFEFSVINTGSGTATVVVNTGVTSIGSLTVIVGDSGLFRVRKTATNTYIVYRIS